MAGGTTFHFVTDGIEAALERARAAAGGAHVRLGGGADTVQQYLRAGLLDELHVVVVPVLLGGGERLFDNLGTRARRVALRRVRTVGLRDPRPASSPARRL